MKWDESLNCLDTLEDHLKDLDYSEDKGGRLVELNKFFTSLTAKEKVTVLDYLVGKIRRLSNEG